MKLNKEHFAKFAFECLLIFISVLAALFIENYREEREDLKNELTLLADITSDLRKDSVRFTNQQHNIKQSISDLNKLISILERKSSGYDSLNDHAFFDFDNAAINATTYESLKSNGGFKLIPDRKLTSKLSEYYSLRSYYSDLAHNRIQDIQDDILQFLTKNTQFTRSDQNDYLVDRKSMHALIGNQEIINLCYIKANTLQQISYSIDDRRESAEELIVLCNSYLKP